MGKLGERKMKKMSKYILLASACLLATVTIQSYASEEEFSTKVGGIPERCMIKWGGTMYEPSNHVVWVGSNVYAKDVSAVEASEILKNLAVARVCL